MDNQAFSAGIGHDIESVGENIPFSRYQEARNKSILQSKVNTIEGAEEMESEYDAETGHGAQLPGGFTCRLASATRCVTNRAKHPFKYKLTKYCYSQRGHELTIALSTMVVLVLTMTGLALLLSNVFGADTVNKHTIDQFFLMLYSLSTLGMLLLLLLGAMGCLTNDHQYRDQTETNFLRGGAVCLGTGGIIYHAIMLIKYSSENVQCLDARGIALHSFAIVFLVVQSAFIMKYSRVRINKTVWLSISSRFLISVVVAANICVWVRTVIDESMEEIERTKKIHYTESGLTSLPDLPGLPEAVTENWLSLKDLVLGQNGSSSGEEGTFEQQEDDTFTHLCTNKSNITNTLSELQHIIQPYTWPLLIEFCVTSSTLLIAVWEKCGHGLEIPYIDNIHKARMHLASLTTMDNVSDVSSVIGYSDTTKDFGSGKKRYYNSQIGFLIGWLMLCTSVVLIIIYLYHTTKTGGTVENNNTPMMIAVYVTTMSLSGICLITIPIAAVKMSSLTFRDDEVKRVMEERKPVQRGRNHKSGNLLGSINRQLLGFTNLALMAFHVMTQIAAVDQGEAVVFINSLVSITMACTQTVFINWYALQKRSTTEEDLAKKPGRQCLEILRFGNFALWLVNTFLVKHPRTKWLQNKTFGVTAWAVVSNLFQPLLILYHFHVVCCIAEVISHSYSLEYIGIIRPSKVGKHLSKNISMSDIGMFRRDSSEPNLYMLSEGLGANLKQENFVSKL